jgi:hypothetical protein
MTDFYLDYRRIARVAALALLVAAFSGCSKKPEVTGEVLDGFGKPLAGATVAVDKTTFATTTDNGGRYAVEYVPGKVLVTIRKEGYTSQDLALDIATEAKYPAVTATLYKVPTEKGLFAFGTSDYTPLQRGLVSVEEPPASNATSITETFSVTGDFVTIDGGSGLTLLDTDGRVPLVYGVGPQGVILKHTQFSGGAVDTAAVFHESVVQIAPGTNLRKVALANGKYAFCNPREFGDNSKIVYLLEVK